jgi:hypothetical protein
VTEKRFHQAHKLHLIQNAKDRVEIDFGDFGPIEGPASVTITATNLALYYTGVIVGANRIQAPSQ